MNSLVDEHPEEQDSRSRPGEIGPVASGVGPPTGTITFLFTDIEGSTRYWEYYPDAMQRTLARHDAVLRDVIAAHGGYIFTTAGDAFSVAFQSPLAAADAAIAAQRRLVSGGSRRDGAVAGPDGAEHRRGRRARR